MLRKILLSVTAILVLAAVSVLPAGAGDHQPIQPLNPPPSAENGVMTNELSARWFVELGNPATANGGSMAATQLDKRAFRANANKYGLKFVENYAYSTLFNGLSITIKPADLGKLSRIPGVKAIYPMGTQRIPVTTEPSNPELYTSLAMIGADVAQSELGFTGAGIKVGVVDTGIDYDHQDLGGDGVTRSNSTHFPTARVTTGYDFVGDAYNADPASASYNPVPTPDAYPDDCYGHGTHVSGIIGANGDVETGGVVGVAPGVTFGAYRIFGCEGSANDDVILAALERAYMDGMDVINMSLGDAYTWPQYPLAKASDSLVNHGIVVVASIGNNGANGLYSAGSPGLGNKVIGVASYDNTNVRLTFFTVNGHEVGFIPMTGAPNPPTSGTSEIVYIGRACNTDALLADPAGKVALAVRGVCPFREKALKAVAAGATAVVIYNSSPGVFSGTVAGTPALTTPVVGISLADGLFIRAQTAPISMTWTDLQGSFPSPTGGLISSFSSYGLSPDLALKPDIGAPGGNIYSTYPLELGGHATLSGTSMASPHVAGAVALYLQAHPKTSTQVIRDILQNSAVPALWALAPSYGLLDNVHRQGAGMLHIDSSILATTQITPGKIATGESQAGPFSQKLTLQNSGPAAVTYDLSYVDALSTGGVITPDYWDSDAWVDFNKTSVTVPAGGNASVNATIYPATYPDFGQYGGYIIFTPQGGGQVYRVPFAGFVGDYQGIVDFTMGPFLTDSALAVQPAGTVFSMTDAAHIPYFAVHLEHQARLLRVEMFAAGSNRAWHRAYNEEYLPRNSSSSTVFAFPFDGTTVAGNKTYTLPDGTYYAVVSVLKANGDASNPAHWETWTSPTFVIDRP